MADTDFLPRRLDRAFSRIAFPEAAKALLVMHGNPEYPAWWDEFIGDSLDAKMPAAAGTNGTIGITAAANGLMRVASNTADDDSAGAALGLHWNGDLGIYFIASLRCDVVTTNVKLEIGLTDAVADDGAINVKGAPSYTASDAALFVLDSDDDDNMTFMTINAGAAGADDDVTTNPVASTFFVVEIVVQNNQASGYHNGAYIGGGAIEGGSNLTPWAYVQSRANPSAIRNLDVDYWGIIGPRT